jgi:hypothetical protein
MVRLVRHNRARPRNYFSRREQWRLLLLILPLGLVIIVMGRLRDPDTARRINSFFSDEKHQVAQVTIPAGAASKSNSVEPPTKTAPTKPPAPVDGVRLELLESVKDETYFRNAERDAWFNLISVLQNKSDKDLAANSIGEAGYVELSQQPQVYRGKLVTVRGTVRQVTTQTPADNDLGLKSYYRLVLHPQGGDIWPIFIYSLELPKGFPPGEHVAVDVSATGFFFKTLSYAWRDGVGIAPVVLTKSVKVVDQRQVAESKDEAARQPVAADNWQSTDSTKTSTSAPDTPPNLSELLSLAGWPPERFADFRFTDHKLLTSDERGQLLELLWRLKRFDPADIAAWTVKDVSIGALSVNPGEFRGKMVQFAGRVRRVTVHKLSTDDAARLEMPRYFECMLLLGDGRAPSEIVTVLTSKVPPAWLQLKKIEKPATVSGLFIKELGPLGGIANVLLISPSVAGENFGRTVLTSLGMDVGLLDGVRNHQPLQASERDAFYAMLGAAGRMGANQLARFALENLDTKRSEWADELRAADESRRALAGEVVRLAEEGRYSVAPLFNEPDGNVGDLFVFDGTARRIVRVDAKLPASHVEDNTLKSPPIDHYYEIELFTEDSQNRPLVFCVRELPPGLSPGVDLREPVRLAGFFFKSWRYRTRNTGHDDDTPDVADDPLGKRLPSPLLIGRAPLKLPVVEGRRPIASIVGAGIFLAALAGIWAAAAWYARGDRRFRDSVLASDSSPPNVQSLNDLDLSANDLNLAAADRPMNYSGPSEEPRGPGAER